MGKKFSLEDFERGLILAGLVPPSTISDHEELAFLAEHDEQIRKKESKLYFKRVILAAEIVEKLHSEPSLGRVKFQKLVFLCEYVAEMELMDRYDRKTAGPFDGKFMHSIGKEFKKQKWFEIEQVKSDNIKRHKFVPLERHENYKSYYENYFGAFDDKIQFIIELFRKQKTEFTELATTVFACYLDLKKKNIVINQTNLIFDFYDWDESKKRFSIEQIKNSFEWLRKNGIIADQPLI